METLTGRGEAFNGFEGALCEGQSLGEVSVGGEGRGKPVTQPSDLGFGREVEVVKSNTYRRWGEAFLGCTPVDEFGFGDQEG